MTLQNEVRSSSAFLTYFCQCLAYLKWKEKKYVTNWLRAQEKIGNKLKRIIHLLWIPSRHKNRREHIVDSNLVHVSFRWEHVIWESSEG